MRIEPRTLCSASIACGASLSMLIWSAYWSWLWPEDGHGDATPQGQAERPAGPDWRGPSCTGRTQNAASRTAGRQPAYQPTFPRTTTSGCGRTVDGTRGAITRRLRAVDVTPRLSHLQRRNGLQS